MNQIRRKGGGEISPQQDSRKLRRGMMNSREISGSRLFSALLLFIYYSYPELLERYDGLDGVLGLQVVEQAERAESVRHSLEHARVELLDDVPLQIKR